MKVVFIGNPKDPADNVGSLTMFGVKFPLNVAVEVSDAPPFHKLMGNSHFRVLDTGSDIDASTSEEDALAEVLKAESALDRDAMIALAEERGVKIDKRWSTEKIAQKIEEAGAC